MADYKQISLRPGRDEAVRRFHPWVFSGALAGVSEQRPETNPADGDIVEVVTHKGEYLGTGHFHNGSIAVRLFSFAAQTGGQRIVADATYWTEKLRAIRAMRQALFAGEPVRRGGSTTAYRLVHGEGDGCSGLVIDWYDGVAVVQAHSIGMHRLRHEITEALRHVFGPELRAVYDKSAETLPEQYAQQVQNGYRYGVADVPHAVQENGHTFLVDWITGQKTGFFLDQRDNRALLGHYAAGRRVLNAFCYSGGFSVYALRAGATLVHSVDASAKAIALTERNVAANELAANGDTETHAAFTDDVLKFLKATDQPYDLLVLDPPAYAKSVSARHRAVQGYKRLNAEGLRRVAPGGIVFTFSCSQVVDRALFHDTVMAAAIEAGRPVRVLHHLSQPADHPVSLFHPEGGYLKGLVLWVE